MSGSRNPFTVVRLPFGGVASEFSMLGWVKDVLAKKESPLEKLLRKGWADDAEKQSLLGAVANDPGVTASALAPLLMLDDTAVQQRAANLFLSRADAAACHGLFHQAVDADEAVRKLLLPTLARTKAEPLTEAIAHGLSDPSKERVRVVWEVVFALRPEQSDPLLSRALVEGPPLVRCRAIERLVATKGADASRPELAGCAGDRDARVRKVALATLSELTGNDVFEVMLDRLAAEDNAELRGVAANYLQTFIVKAPKDLRPQIFGRLLLSGDTKIQAQLLKALFASGQTGELLLEILTFCKSLLGVQHAIVMNALHALGAVLVPEIIKLLAHGDPDIRIQALLLLGRFPGGSTTAATVKMLGDGDWWVRIMACEALGRLKDERAIQHLDRLLNDPDAKWAAIDAVGEIGGQSAFATLIGRLKDREPEMRLAAIDACKKLADPRVDGYLEDVAKSDASIDNRIRAIEVLRERRGGKATAEKTAVSSSQLERPIEKLLAFARESGASDLHLTPDEPPIVRINGGLVRTNSVALGAAQVETLLEDILDPVRREILFEKGAVDFCYPVLGVGRYRVNVFTQQRGISAAFRTIPNVPPLLSELGLPKRLEEISTFHQGIVLITGPAGSGKSTSLTALVNVINESRDAHVLMLEDPIEFLHTSKKSLVNQREIGRDSKSFAAAMRGALREDPDIIVIGEMRDSESIRLALLAAETGHLVIASMQTTGAVATIDKLVESFPVDEQSMLRGALAGSMKLVVSQTLIPRGNGKGRVAVFEILKSTSGVRALIRDGKTFQLPSAMTVGRSEGMLTVDAHLEELVNAGAISIETAYDYATKKDAFVRRPDGTAGAKKVAEGAPQSVAVRAAPVAEAGSAKPALDPGFQPPTSSRAGGNLAEQAKAALQTKQGVPPPERGAIPDAVNAEPLAKPEPVSSTPVAAAKPAPLPPAKPEPVSSTPVAAAKPAPLPPAKPEPVSSTPVAVAKPAPLPPAKPEPVSSTPVAVAKPAPLPPAKPEPVSSTPKAPVKPIDDDLIAFLKGEK